MINRIELPILHHNDSTSLLKDIGVEYSLEQCEVRDMIFYHINAISPYYDNDKEYTNIHTNGSEYICPLKIEQVRKVITHAIVRN